MKNSVRIYILLFVIALSKLSLGANTERDSLLVVLEKHKIDDSTKANLLIEISKTHWFDYGSTASFRKSADTVDLFNKYINELLEISSKISYTKGTLYAKYFQLVNNNDSADVIINQINTLSETTNNNDIKAISHLAHIIKSYQSKDYDNGILHFNEIKKNEKEINDTFLILEAYTNTSRIISRINELPLINYFDRIEFYADHIKSYNLKVAYFYFSANYYAQYPHKYKENFDRLFEKLIQCNNKLKAPNYESAIYTIKGNSYNISGDYSNMIKYFYKAFEISKKANNLSRTTITSQALSWGYYRLHEYEKAKLYGYFSLKQSKNINNHRFTARNLKNIGLCLTEQDSLTKAKKCFIESLTLCKKYHLNYEMAWSYLGLALLSDKESNYTQAKVYYKKALQYIRSIGELHQAIFYSTVANHYLLTKEYNKSLNYADSAYQIAFERNDLANLRDASRIIHEIHSIRGDLNLAYGYLLNLHELNNRVKENEAKHIGLVSEFEMKTKEKELEQEKKDLIKLQEIKRHKQFRNIFIFGFCIVIILILIIFRNYKQKQKQHQIILESNEELKQLNESIAKHRNEIVDSINYAQRIQSAMLPPESYISELIHENFIFYKPKDIVSGDFYWVKQVNQYIVITAADCTGHGVPGAFMSMLGISFLNEIVQKREITQANQVLNELRKQVKHSLRQHGGKDTTMDGMDMALCVLDTKTYEMQYAGAYNSLILIKDIQGKPELQEIKADRMPVGFYQGKDKSFSNHEIQLEMGDTFYIFSDGFMDQMGGPEGKKFMSKNFKKLLFDIHDQPMHEQKEILDKTINTWMNGTEQMDDMLVIGVRV